MILRYPLERLRASLAPEHFAALEDAGTTDAKWLCIGAAEAAEIRARYAPVSRAIIAPEKFRSSSTFGRPIPAPVSPPVPAPKPPAQDWPKWAAEMRAQSLPGERSIVDTIERLIGPFGSDEFKVWHGEVFGVYSKTCNCALKRAAWSVAFRYAV